MKQYYILVADSSKAKTFLFDRSARQLDEISDLVHGVGRQQEREIDSDRAGRRQGGDGTSHHGVNVEDESKEYEKTVFAKEIGKQLEKDRAMHNPEGLVVIAPPHFLGILRKELSKACQSLLVQTVNKNLVQSSTEEILNHIE